MNKKNKINVNFDDKELNLIDYLSRVLSISKATLIRSFCMRKARQEYFIIKESKIKKLKECYHEKEAK